MIGFFAVTVIGEGADQPPRAIPHALDRTKPGREAGALMSITPDLNARSEKLVELNGHLYNYTYVCFDHPEDAIRDYGRLNDSKQIIPGPKSHLARSQDPD